MAKRKLTIWQLLDAIRLFPDSTAPQLARYLGVLPENLHWHAHNLMSQGFITRYKDYTKKPYYPFYRYKAIPAGKLLTKGERSKEQIIHCLKLHSKCTVDDLKSLTMLTPRSIQHHLRELIDKKIVVKEKNSSLPPYTMKTRYSLSSSYLKV